MLCQKCQERPAAVHFTKIVGGEKSEFHFCETCAKEQAELNQLFTKAVPTFDFNQLLSGLLNMESSPGFTTSPPTTLRCETCGMTYAQFSKIGRFGCPNCYESLAPRLEPLLRRIQTATNHTGKIPLRTGEQVKTKKGLERLRKELQQSISLEQFERAAQLRDQIREMEQEFEK